MTDADAPAPPASLADHVRDKLAGSAPVTLADLKKGRKAPPKKSGQTLDGLVLEAVGEAERDGRAFAAASGKGGAKRYWHRDEAEAVRQAVLAAAAEPRTVAELKKAGAAGLKADAGFVEAVARGLIGEDRLFEYPAKTKAGGPRFATVAPPPPLAQGKFPGRVDKLVRDVAKLAADARVTTDDVLAAVRARQTPDESAAPAPAAELDDLILKAVAEAAPTLLLPDLRRELPAEYRGPAFDAAVLRLAAARRV